MPRSLAKWAALPGVGEAIATISTSGSIRNAATCRSAIKPVPMMPTGSLAILPLLCKYKQLRAVGYRSQSGLVQRARLSLDSGGSEQSARAMIKHLQAILIVATAAF